jgi:hypothetical protein
MKSMRTDCAMQCFERPFPLSAQSQSQEPKAAEFMN